MSAIKVVRAGLFDTLQDLGRIGYMALGMPTAGAMDRIGLTLANALAGNPANTAGLEIGVMGPDLLVEVNLGRRVRLGDRAPRRDCVTVTVAGKRQVDVAIGDARK